MLLSIAPLKNRYQNAVACDDRHSHAHRLYVSQDSAHLSWAKQRTLLQVLSLTEYDSSLEAGLSSIPCTFFLGSRLKEQVATKRCFSHSDAREGRPIYNKHISSLYIPLVKASHMTESQSQRQEIFFTYHEVMSKVWMYNASTGE